MKNKFIESTNKPFLQIGFQRDMSLTLTTQNSNQKFFEITIIEEIFFLFIPCFYNHTKEYSISSSSQFTVNFTYEEIISKLKKIEGILLKDKIELFDLLDYFSDFQYYDFNFKEYTDYINEYKLAFEISFIQLQEWLEKNIKNNNKLIIYGY